MSHPDSLHNEEEQICTHWKELDNEAGQSVEYCNAKHCSVICCGMKIECENGMFMPNINEDNPFEDR